jgi:hypothetical protein
MQAIDSPVESSEDINTVGPRSSYVSSINDYQIVLSMIRIGPGEQLAGFKSDIYFVLAEL